MPRSRDELVSRETPAADFGGQRELVGGWHLGDALSVIALIERGRGVEDRCAAPGCCQAA